MSSSPYLIYSSRFRSELASVGRFHAFVAMLAIPAVWWFGMVSPWQEAPDSLQQQAQAICSKEPQCVRGTVELTLSQRKFSTEHPVAVFELPPMSEKQQLQIMSKLRKASTGLGVTLAFRVVNTKSPE